MGCRKEKCPLFPLRQRVPDSASVCRQTRNELKNKVGGWTCRRCFIRRSIFSVLLRCLPLCSILRYSVLTHFLFLDIDSFKQINDTFGHHEGDNALKSVATVLKTLCKTTGGFCARYGGDEFAVIQVLKKSGDIKKIKKNIYDSVEKITDENSAYSLSVSICCAQHTSETESVQELISCADSNMYSKKMQRKEKVKR